MGVPTDGNPFGVPEGLFCSLPVHCRGDGEWAFAEKYRLPCEGERQLDASIEVSSGAARPACKNFNFCLLSLSKNTRKVQRKHKMPNCKTENRTYRVRLKIIEKMKN